MDKIYIKRILSLWLRINNVYATYEMLALQRTVMYVTSWDPVFSYRDIALRLFFTIYISF